MILLIFFDASFFPIRKEINLYYSINKKIIYSELKLILKKKKLYYNFSILAEQTLNSGILAIGSKAGLVNTLAAASLK